MSLEKNNTSVQGLLATNVTKNHCLVQGRVSELYFIELFDLNVVLILFEIAKRTNVRTEYILVLSKAWLYIGYRKWCRVNWPVNSLVMGNIFNRFKPFYLLSDCSLIYTLLVKSNINPLLSIYLKSRIFLFFILFLNLYQ